MMTATAVSVKLGQPVPDFELATYEPNPKAFGSVSLAQQKASKRWTILFFYPADFTFVCSTEFAALAEHHERFARMGCDIVTVSTDTQFTHLAWQRHEKELADVGYSMGADPTQAVSRQFGVLDESTGLALRGTFLIDPDGVLVATEVNYYSLGRNIDELLRKFKASLYMAKRAAAGVEEVCPSKWRDEGDRTLVSPGADMVGRVHEALQEV